MGALDPEVLSVKQRALVVQILNQTDKLNRVLDEVAEAERRLRVLQAHIGTLEILRDLNADG